VLITRRSCRSKAASSAEKSLMVRALRAVGVCWLFGMFGIRDLLFMTVFGLLLEEKPGRSPADCCFTYRYRYRYAQFEARFEGGRSKRKGGVRNAKREPC
jgi:hypothetical protein